MLRLIPRERFESINKGKQPDHRMKLDLEDIEWPYYEIPETNSWLIYLKELKLGLVFGEVPEDTEISYDDWKLEKIGDRPNPKFILNIMKSCVFIDNEFYKTVEAGEWLITNTRYEFPISFSIKVCGTYFKETAIGYDEKLKIPLDKAELRLKDKLIENIGYGLRGNSKKSS